MEAHSAEPWEILDNDKGASSAIIHSNSLERTRFEFLKFQGTGLFRIRFAFQLLLGKFHTASFRIFEPLRGYSLEDRIFFYIFFIGTKVLEYTVEFFFRGSKW